MQEDLNSGKIVEQSKLHKQIHLFLGGSYPRFEPQFWHISSLQIIFIILLAHTYS